MIAAIFSLTVLGLALGYILAFAAKRFAVESNPVVDEIESLMPGSQCGQCGYPGCAPAAEAVANGTAPVTLCPPGGKALAEQLAGILQISVDLSDMEDEAPAVARVVEELCIGCAKCMKVCPTDAVLGGPKQMHAVIMDACTACKACVDVCPTESMIMEPIKVSLRDWAWPKPAMPEAA
ncbi:MAG: RnfABCDGE type electron transport complex subunit B [Gammaproteobacteria bacterium]